jgi:hypothetical protein
MQGNSSQRNNVPAPAVYQPSTVFCCSPRQLFLIASPQTSVCRTNPCRITFMNLPNLYLCPRPHLVNRIPRAMPAGSSICTATTFTTSTCSPRSRKVKCNRIPGQEKVFQQSFTSQQPAYHSCPKFSARYFSSISPVRPVHLSLLVC